MRPPRGSTVTLPGALLLLLAAAGAGGGTTGVLRPVRAAVVAKQFELGLSVGTRSREQRALGRSLALLDRDRTRVDEECRDAARVCRTLDRAFPGDPDLGPPMASALDALATRVLEDRAALLAWMGRLDGPREERILARTIGSVDRGLAKADGTEPRWRGARLRGAASRRIHRARQRLFLDDPSAGDPPFQGVAPDFSLLDANPASATYGTPVSPRDYAGYLAAFYFPYAT